MKNERKTNPPKTRPKQAPGGSASAKRTRATPGQGSRAHTQMDAALHESEARFLALFRAIPIPTYTWQYVENDFVLVDCNEMARSFTAGKVADLIGAKASQMYRDDEQILQDLKCCYQQKTTLERELDTRLKSTGQRKYINVKYAYLPPDLVMVLTEDATERKRTEQMLQDNAERYRELVESSQSLIYSHDLHGQILSVNHTAALMMGYPPAVLVGKNLRELMAPEPPEQFRKYQADIQKKGSAAGVWVLQTATGEPRTWEYRSSLRTLSGAASIVHGMAHDITDRKRAEAALQKSEARYRLLAENVSDVIWILDLPEARFRYVSPSVQRLRGYTFEEVLARPMSAALTPASNERVARQIQERLARFQAGGSSIYVDEMEHPCKDGTTVWTETTTHYLLNQETGHIEVYGVSRDIRARKQAEEKLRLSEAFNQALISHSPIGVSVRTPTGQLLYTNAAWKRIWAMPDRAVEEDLTRPRQALTFDERDEYLNPHLEDIRKVYRHGGQLYLPDLKTSSKRPGVAGWVSQYFYALPDETGAVSQVVILTEDITASKQAEEAVRASELRLRELIETSPDGITVTDMQGRITVANLQTAALLGVENPQECIGHLAVEFFAPEDQPRALENMRQTLLTGKLRNIEYSLVRKDGSHVPIEMSVSVIKDAQGKPESFIAVTRDITARKQAEEALRAGDERNRVILQTAMEGIWRMDLQGRLLEVNAAYCQMSGYTEQELLGMRVADLEALEQAADTLAHIQKIVAEGPDRFETRHKRKDGSTFDLQVSIQYYPAEGGWMVVFLRDISAEKARQAALRASEAALQQAQRVAHVGSWKWHIQRNFLEWSDEMYAIFGLDQAAFGGSLSEVVANSIHPDDRARVEESNRSVAEQGQPIPLEYRVVRPDGVIRTVWAEAGEMLRNESGQPALLTGIVQDITARKQAEEALRRSEARFRAVVENSNDGILFGDANAVIHYRSPSYARINGYTDEERLGRSGFETVHPEDVEKVRLYWAEVVQSPEKCVRSEYRIRHKDGAWRWIESSAQNLLHNPDVQAIFVNSRDITSRKQAEAELAQSREQLRALGQHLQAAREQERAYIAREIHDELGQSLTAMKMDLAWLARQLPPEHPRLHAKLADMTGVVDDTIQTVRRVAGELRPGMLDDLGLVPAMEWQAGEFQSRTGIVCQLDLPGQTGPLGPELTIALFRIFQEALTNISRHARATRARVQLKERPDGIDLLVQDNGIGISPEQINDPRSLGLIGMRERLQALGGTLQIESASGQGATLRVSIPLSPPLPPPLSS